MLQRCFVFVCFTFSLALHGATNSSCMSLKKAKKQPQETKESNQQTQPRIQAVPYAIQVRKKQADTLQQLLIGVPFMIDENNVPNPEYAQRKVELLTFLDDNAQRPPEIRLQLDGREEQANRSNQHTCWERFSKDRMPYLPPLKGAVLSFDLEVVRRMIALKADVNHPDEHGNTPFMYAHNGPMMQALVDAGANVCVKNKAGLDILHEYNCPDEPGHGDGENEARCIATMVHIVFHALLQDTFGNIPPITHLIGDYVHGKIIESDACDPEIHEVDIQEDIAHRDIKYTNIEPYLEPLETFAQNNSLTQ